MGCGGSKTEGFDAGDGVESESSEPAPQVHTVPEPGLQAVAVPLGIPTIPQPVMPQDIPGAYYASGAAIPQANGVYVRDGTYSGAPLFKNGQARSPTEPSPPDPVPSL